MTSSMYSDLIIQSPNRNAFWADLIVEEFVRAGINAFFIAPGSRSTPLTAAVARHRTAKSFVHFDERGNAFAALGYGRATGKPGVWLTTSGTAAANGLPAVIESSIDGVPLILLTADRPPELRKTGANQTIDQPGLFGSGIRWSFDLPTPSDEIDPEFVLTTIGQAIYRTTANGAGPVHLNCMFREPLAPRSEPFSPPESGRFNAWLESDLPYTRYPATTRLVAQEELNRVLTRAERPICVLGRITDARVVSPVLDWARRSGVPVLADINSQYRLGEEIDGLVAYHDLILESESFRAEHRPDSVIQIGKAPTSKNLANFLSDADPESFIVVVDGPERIDPAHCVSLRIDADTAGVVHLFEGLHDLPRTSPDWSSSWQSAGRLMGNWLRDRFGTDADSELSEQGVARRLTEEIQDGMALVLGSSMPVRHVDSFGSVGRARVSVVSNRGASGIDGTIATAAGYAQGSGARTTVFLGDLALLHDLNSLPLAARHHLIVVVINNDGGGIFSYLPIADHTDVFEPFFGTPHGFGFEQAAEMFGLDYHSATSHGDFQKSYRRALESQGATMIEVRTSRKGNHDLHLELMSAAGQILDQRDQS